MMADAPRVLRYRDGEFLLAYGPQDGPQLLVLQPLFEEMNRCRALVAALCRALAARGIGCWLPDLPGTGESACALESLGWSDWQSAVAEVQALSGAQGMIAIRGGALLDGAATGRRWRLAPTSGRSLLSDLRRSALAGGGDPASPAGYRFSADFGAAFAAAEVVADAAARTLRLVSDDRPADRHIDAPPLWRRSEPAADAALADLIAEDIADWTRA